MDLVKAPAKIVSGVAKADASQRAKDRAKHRVKADAKRPAKNPVNLGRKRIAHPERRRRSPSQKR